MCKNKPDDFNKQCEPYTYMAGAGFVANENARNERRTLVLYANSAGLSLVLLLFLREALPAHVIRIFVAICPQLRYTNAHLIGPEWLVQMVQWVCTLLAFAVPFLVYSLMLRLPLRTSLPTKPFALTVVVPAIFILFGASVLGSFTSSVLTRLLRTMHIIPIRPAVPLLSPACFNNPYVWFLFALVGLCVLPALVEEFVFRGVLMQSLRRFGDGFALITSAVLFCLFHRSFAQMPTALLSGLVIGYFVLHTGSVWVGVLLHFCNNVLALVQQSLLPHLPQRASVLIEYALPLLLLLLALISVILLARGREGLLHSRKVQSPLTMRQRACVFFSSPAVLVLLFFIAASTLSSVQILP